MPIVVGVVFFAVLAVLVGYGIAQSRSAGATGQTVAGIQCQGSEMLQNHYHAHLQIIYKGTNYATAPSQTGITPKCLYWMHTHTDSGIIHIESPGKRAFTLGDFFQIWNQPLSKTQVGSFSAGKGESMKVWVDGNPYAGDPNKIQLKSHTSVVIEIGPSFVDPPVFDWTSPAVVQESGSS